MDMSKNSDAPSHHHEYETKEEFVKRCFTYKECQLFFPNMTDSSEI